jgi:hypothetical protein
MPGGSISERRLDQFLSGAISWRESFDDATEQTDRACVVRRSFSSTGPGYVCSVLQAA